MITNNRPLVEATMSERRTPARSLLLRTGRVARESILPVALLVLIVVGASLFPSFRTVENLLNIVLFSSVLLIVAIGQTFVVIGRAADLAVGSLVGLGGAVFGTLVLADVPWILAGALTLMFGGILGFLQSALIRIVGISFIIVTLGTFTIFRSQAQVVLSGQSVTVPVPELVALVNGRIGFLPNLVLFAVLLYVVAEIVLRLTTYGRSLYAIGANPDAAVLAGLPYVRISIISFVISAVCASLAGILVVGQLGSAQPMAGGGMELAALSAVLLGGTRFSGGFGSVTRTVVGVLFLGVVNSLLTSAGVSSFWQGTAAGVVLIVAVALDRTRKD